MSVGIRPAWGQGAIAPTELKLFERCKGSFSVFERSACVYNIYVSATPSEVEPFCHMFKSDEERVSCSTGHWRPDHIEEALSGDVPQAVPPPVTNGAPAAEPEYAELAQWSTEDDIRTGYKELPWDRSSTASRAENYDCLAERQRINKQTIALVNDPTNACALSAANLWEQQQKGTWAKLCAPSKVGIVTQEIELSLAAYQTCASSLRPAGSQALQDREKQQPNEAQQIVQDSLTRGDNVSSPVDTLISAEGDRGSEGSAAIGILFQAFAGAALGNVQIRSGSVVQHLPPAVSGSFSGAYGKTYAPPALCSKLLTMNKTPGC